MTKFNILIYPNKNLLIPADPVEEITDDIQRLIDDMFETMYANHGAGLAATQVNAHKQIFILDFSYEFDVPPYVMINPKIIRKEGKQCGTEGCLSFPLISAEIERAKHVVVEALDRKGKQFTLEAEGRLAVGVQHEYEHLLGKVYLDNLSTFKKQWLIRKMKKLCKKYSMNTT